MFCPSTPTNEDRLVTSGSRRMARPSACWWALIAASEVVWLATEMPWITPVSCTGKNPLGIITASATVSATLSVATARVSGWLSSTTARARP